ncbi:MAG: ABC transporter ATP-binding protein [Proteobacteria bacterium]|jgi:lipoprotein-releasing system ATP-binding protein|nr:ABC transporter ATP-binding protein [Pseudomonadota bacterium]
MSQNAVEISDLQKIYPMGELQLEALAGVSFTVAAGECLAIVGESGSGKSTLLHIVGALDSPTKGQVRVGGMNPFTGSDREVSHFRNRHIGFVFQHNNLLPEFSALENVVMPGLIAGGEPEATGKRATALLERVGLGKRLGHFPGQLSGGEQQRVAIARALINQPVLVLADEPSGNLDSRNAANIHQLFAEINRELKTTLLVVTHNQEFAHSLPRRIEMRDGRIIGDSGR